MTAPPRSAIERRHWRLVRGRARENNAIVRGWVRQSTRGALPLSVTVTAFGSWRSFRLRSAMRRPHYCLRASGVEGVFEELEEFVAVDWNWVGGDLGGGAVGGFAEIVAL